MTGSRIGELALVGGHCALDLVNTVSPRLPAVAQQDRLETPEDLLTWSERSHLIAPGEVRQVAAAWRHSPAAARRAHGEVKEIREALWAVLSACLDPASERGQLQYELDYLSRSWAASMSRSRLSLGKDGTVARMVSCSPPELLVSDRVAQESVDLLCRADLQRLGRCPPDEGGCGWLFLDLTRNRSRRWCAMDACGSGAKARRLTERRRLDRADTHP